MNTYGVIGSDGCYIDTSNTLHGAKCHATRNGFKEVYIRLNGSCDVALLMVKRAKGIKKGVWVNVYNN